MKIDEINDKEMSSLFFSPVFAYTRRSTGIFCTSNNIFKTPNKPGSFEFLQLTKLNENILHKTGIEVFPPKVFRPTPVEYRHIYPRFQINTSVAFRFNHNRHNWKGKAQYNFYSHIQEVLVVKTKNWTHPRLFAVSHSMLQRQKFPAGQFRVRQGDKLDLFDKTVV